MGEPRVNEELEKAVASLSEDNFDFALLSDERDVCYVSGFSPAYQNGPSTLLPGPNLALIGKEAPGGWLMWPQSTPTKGDVEHKGVSIGSPIQLSMLDSSVLKLMMPGEIIWTRCLRCLSGRRSGIGATELCIQFQCLPFFVAEAIKQKYPKIQFAASPALMRAKRTKTRREIKLIKEAVALSDMAQESAVDHATEGMTEIELWSQVETGLMTTLGHRVHTIMELVSGPRTGVINFPAGPTNRRMVKRDTIILD